MEWKYDICSLIVTMSNVSWSNGICNENSTISYCIMHIDSVKFHLSHKTTNFRMMKIYF